MSQTKRAASYFDDDDESESEFGTPPPKRGKGAKRSSGDKVAKKAARMQRNRIAAQASRDRKKQHVEILEARVAELEGLLANASATSPPPAIALLPSTVSTPASTLSASLSLAPSSGNLEEENATLRARLEVELLQSASLKARLGSLEDKFARLESLLRAPSPSSSSLNVTPVVPTSSTTSTTSMTSPSPSPLSTATTNDLTMMMTDSSCLVAAEAVPPIIVTGQSSATSSAAAAISAIDSDVTTTDITPDPVFDLGTDSLLHHEHSSHVSHEHAEFDQFTIDEAWREWANNVVVPDLPNSNTLGLETADEWTRQTQQTIVDEEEGSDENTFDLFAYLRQDTLASVC